MHPYEAYSPPLQLFNFCGPQTLILYLRLMCIYLQTGMLLLLYSFMKICIFRFSERNYLSNENLK